jgi:hypothetical protein
MIDAVSSGVFRRKASDQIDVSTIMLIPFVAAADSCNHRSQLFQTVP